jgi:hypothetical protein
MHDGGDGTGLCGVELCMLLSLHIASAAVMRDRLEAADLEFVRLVL